MKSNIQKPSLAATIIALITAIVTLGVFFLVTGLFNVNMPIVAPFFSAVIVGFVSYAVARIAINEYVFTKVKLIFKTIHDIKVGTEKEEDQIAKSSNLDMVEKEVMEWAEERKSELDDLRIRENYRREFIGNVSHELKTPIFNIQGYILTLIDGGLEDSKINMKYLRRASKSVDRLINLVQDMDTLNKLESGILLIKKQRFAIDQLVAEVYEMMEDSAKKHDVKLKLINKTGSKEVMVLADPSRIEQVLVNLISNAIKYGLKEKGLVSISLFDLDDRVLVEVADNGPGIPEKDLARIFERFYRVDKSRTRDAGGSGLGLSIVKHILDGHQEAISVQSTMGVGSTFSFTLKKA